jgi:hypothetical protein
VAIGCPGTLDPFDDAHVRRAHTLIAGPDGSSALTATTRPAISFPGPDASSALTATTRAAISFPSPDGSGTVKPDPNAC